MTNTKNTVIKVIKTITNPGLLRGNLPLLLFLCPLPGHRLRNRDYRRGESNDKNTNQIQDNEYLPEEPNERTQVICSFHNFNRDISQSFSVNLGR